MLFLYASYLRGFVKIDKKNKVRLTVFFSFAAFIIIGILFAYFLNLVPSPVENCVTKCHSEGLRGYMTYKYKKEVTAGMRGKGPMKCTCYK